MSATPNDRAKKVRVQLFETSASLEYDDALNTYTKGPMFCVFRANSTVEKFWGTSIFRVIEDYE